MAKRPRKQFSKPLNLSFVTPKQGVCAAEYLKYRLLFKQLSAFADEKGLTFRSEWDVELLRQFRESWHNKNYSARKKLEALADILSFCLRVGMVTTN